MLPMIAALKRDNIKKVGLLGTKFTMTQDFIKDRLRNLGLEVIIPDEDDIEVVNDVIFNELCLGNVLDTSRDEYKRIISYMKDRGAEGVILGCTEIGMLISEEDSVLPTYDTTVIHAKEAAKEALS
ncbi:MAG: amino acid racemase [Lachnospiraceae bacterium]|nr:amino acid racemase [Lachnospiraceae bacterium]